MLKWQFPLLLATLLVTIIPGPAQAAPPGELLTRLKMLPAQSDVFSGHIEWVCISMGVQGGTLIDIETLPAEVAYAALHTGRNLPRLPLATIEWHSYTSTSQHQRTQTAWYQTSNSPQINAPQAREISAKLSALKQESTFAPSVVVLPGFDFISFKTEVITPAGTQINSILPDGTTTEFTRRGSMFQHSLSKMPNPIRWPVDSEFWNQVLEKARWSPGPSGNLTATSRRDDTSYTIQLGENEMPSTMTSEKVMPGGWTRIIAFKYDGWREINSYWVPELITVNITLKSGTLSAPLNKRFVVLNAINPAPAK